MTTTQRARVEKIILAQVHDNALGANEYIRRARLEPWGAHCLMSVILEQYGNALAKMTARGSLSYEQVQKAMQD